MPGDVTDLFEHLEETFSIKMKDEETSQIRSVDQLQRYIICKLRNQNRIVAERPCPTLVAFNYIRRVLVREFGIERKRVRPDTLVPDLFPQNKRRERWARFVDIIGGNQMSLTRPMWLSSCMIFAALVYLGLHTYHDPARFWVWAVSGFLTYLFIWSLLDITRRFAVHPTRPFHTVGAIASGLTFSDYFDASRRGALYFSEGEARDVCKAVLVERLFVAPEDVTPDAELVRDLGCD